jgi:hypothetical protein
MVLCPLGKSNRDLVTSSRLEDWNNTNNNIPNGKENNAHKLSKSSEEIYFICDSKLRRISSNTLERNIHTSN